MIVRNLATNSSWCLEIDHPVPINRDTPPLQEGSRHSEQILAQRANSSSEKGEYRAVGRGFFSISTNLVATLRTIIIHCVVLIKKPQQVSKTCWG
jgi:hypothetical protein